MNPLLAATAALTTTVLIASGCASTDAGTTTPAPRGEPVYRTGSNIPVRETLMTKEERDRRAEEAQRPAQPAQAAGGSPKTN